MIVLNARFLVVLLAIFGTSQAAKKTKCEVVRALRAKNSNISNNELRNWLCLVDKESSFRYDVTNWNSNGSTDYGIFQLNSNYWCDRSNGYSGTHCPTLRTRGCQYDCKDYKNSDISDDVDCAVRVKNCDGFRVWVGWRNKCGNVNVPKYDPSGC